MSKSISQTGKQNASGKLSAQNYAFENNMPYEERVTAILFRNIADNFYPESYQNIMQHPDWQQRTRKPHPNVPNLCEMQSSNSSDALLMNIFCHPRLLEWNSLRELLGTDLNASPVFGFHAEASINQGGKDRTEIDMVLPGLFVAAKYTEEDFTCEDAQVVARYYQFEKVFHSEALSRVGEKNESYDNCQLIRNLIAAREHQVSHALFCNQNRRDLIRRYYETVACLRDVEFRKRCRVFTWQEIMEHIDDNLADWVETRYGLISI